MPHERAGALYARASGPGGPWSEREKELLASSATRGEENHPCPTEDGQHIGSCLHQQDGRNSVPYPKQPEQGVLAMVHGKRHICPSATLSRETKQHHGCGIQGDEGQYDWRLCPQQCTLQLPEVHMFIGIVWFVQYVWEIIICVDRARILN